MGEGTESTGEGGKRRRENQTCLFFFSFFFFSPQPAMQATRRRSVFLDGSQRCALGAPRRYLVASCAWWCLRWRVRDFCVRSGRGENRVREEGGGVGLADAVRRRSVPANIPPLRLHPPAAIKVLRTSPARDVCAHSPVVVTRH